MTRHARCTAAIALGFLGAFVWLGAPSTVQADGTKVFVGAGTPLGLHPMPPVPRLRPRPFRQPRFGPYPYAYSAPVWPSGYWSYLWVPQVYTAWVLVPGGLGADGSWVDAHYEPRIYQSGYYQQVWVGAVPPSP